MPHTATRFFAVLGSPVSHSLSPVMHNAAFRAAGLDAVYGAVECDAHGVPDLMRRLAAVGGGNVTLPHKELAASVVDRATDAVERTGACNTFWGEHGLLYGDNTDIAGFAAAVRDLVGSVEGARVLVLGAGGAAVAAVAALLNEPVDAVVLENRSPHRARTLQQRLDPGGRRVRLSPPASEGARDVYDLVVNATPLGLAADDPLPLDPDRLHTARAVLDLTYSASDTPLVRAARAAGLPATDGLDMLLHQGAAAFERWWHRPAPLDAMRGALDAARRRDAS